MQAANVVEWASLVLVAAGELVMGSVRAAVLGLKYVLTYEGTEEIHALDLGRDNRHQR